MRAFRYMAVYNRRGQLDKQGFGTVSICVSDYYARRYVNTGVKLLPSQWDSRRRIVRPGVAGSREKNEYLRSMVADMEAREWSLRQSGIAPTLETVIRQTTAKRSYLVTEFVRTDYINSRAIKRNTVRKYITLCKHLDAYKKGLHLGGIDYKFVTDFATYLRNCISVNSARQMLSTLRAVVREAIRRDLMDSNPFERIQLQSQRVEHESLTVDEVSAIERAGGLSATGGIVRDMFLLSVYTGLRISDILALTPHDVRIIDGERWLYRKTIKTGAVVEIPLSRIFGGKGDRILLKYGIGKGIDDRYFKLSPNVTNSIREFCTAAGITKRVTFHTARRTSATLLQSMGIATNVVQKILGHSNISTTQIYAQTTHDQIATAVKTAFAQ